jgi:phage gpG-like protein
MSIATRDGQDDVIEGALALARETLGMDAAHVSEFTSAHQVLRHVEGDTARFGLEAGTAIPVEGTYCRRVVDGRIPNVVPDTAAEPEVRDLPVTRDAGLGAYVGVPVTAPDGEVLGSFCCLSRSPDPALAERDIAFMHVLARLVGDRLVRQRRERDERVRLEQQVAERTAELTDAVASLARAQAETARRLSMAVEYRDDHTGAHIERVGRLAAALARAAGMEDAFCTTIALAAPLHDVGKVAAPDAVLLKRGALDPEERRIIEEHPETGYRLLEGSSSEVLRMAASIARTHHERFDGKGYGRGLRGHEIPVEGRIVAIVDVFDALTSDRVYRSAMPAPAAVEAMRRDEGHFDPVLLDRFVRDVLPGLEHDAPA